MDGWGEVIGRLIEGVADGLTTGPERGDVPAPWAMGRDAQEQLPPNATVDRLLTGGRRELNINDR